MNDTNATATIELPPVRNLDVPAAFAPAVERQLIESILADMKTQGWSRPMISAITGFTDSQVWRAQRGKTHTVEVDRWNAFLQGVKDGTFRPTVRAAKATAKDALARLQRLANMFAEADGLKAADLRALVAEARELLPAPATADATDDTEGTEPESTDATDVPEQADAQD